MERFLGWGSLILLLEFLSRQWFLKQDLKVVIRGSAYVFAFLLHATTTLNVLIGGQEKSRCFSLIFWIAFKIVRQLYFWENHYLREFWHGFVPCGQFSIMELVDAAIPSQHLEPYKRTILGVEGVKVGRFRIPSRTTSLFLIKNYFSDMVPFTNYLVQVIKC